MFDFEAWMRAYVKVAFGGDAVLRDLDDGLWSVAWPVAGAGNEVGQGIVLVEVLRPLQESLHRGTEERRGEIGQKTTAYLIQRMVNYRAGNAAPVKIDLGEELAR